MNKVIGLAIGEKSLLAAEVTAGERPDVKRTAEFVYPEGMSPQNPGQLGKALGDFLRDQKFTAKNAVVGLPARWLVVKPKDVPPADPTTLASMLRLQAEGEFSSELKDLVYDYAADSSAGHPRSVLLIATPKKYIDAALTICESARLTAEIITASAVALGSVTGRSVAAKNPLVLLVSPAGAELTAQSGSASSAIRHLRGPGPDRPFVGELRRAISGMPGTGVNGSPRELVLWDAAGSSSFDSATLGESLGVTVRTGDLPIFGVDTTEAGRNGDGRKYAAAVSLALLGVTEESRPVDFLHSRLAPPPEPLIKSWIIYSAVAGVVLLSLIVLAVTAMQRKERTLDALKASNSQQESSVKTATEFENKVTVAKAWHLGMPRYQACLADLARAIPEDGRIYALSLKLNDTPPQSSSFSPAEILLQTAKITTLVGHIECKSSDKASEVTVAQQMNKLVINGRKPFSHVEVKNSRSNEKVANKRSTVSDAETTFNIEFTYTPPAASH